MNTQNSRVAWALAALLAAGWPGMVSACSMNVREAGFINNAGGPYESRPYMLEYVFKGERSEADALMSRLSTFADKELAGINLSIELTDGNNLKPEQRETLKQAGADPDALPLSIVRRLVYYEPELVTVLPGALNEDALRSMAASPKKLELRKLLSVNTNYCVFVFIPGSDQQATAAALRELKAAIAQHDETFPGQHVPIMTLSRTDAAESLLLKELSVAPDAVKPHAAIVFGKLRLLTPTFAGEDIQKDALLGALEFLHHNASDCNEDPVDVPGATRDLLCAWSPALSMRMVQAVAESGAVPDMPWWNEAEVDPQTGELIEQSATAKAPADAAQVAAEERAVPAPRPAWLPALPIGAGVLLAIVAGVLLTVLVVGWLVARAKMKR